MNISKIRKLCLQYGVRISRHASERLDERNITIDEVEQTILYGEVIEERPWSTPLPSCLMFYIHMNGRPIHVVVGLDGDNDEISLITAYIPSSDKWEDDFKTRRK